MPLNGKTDFVGPSRLRFMNNISAQEKATQLNDAIVEANMKGLYGDRWKMPEVDTNVGGDVIYPTPIIMAAPPQRSNAGLIVACVFLGVMVLALLAGGAWLIIHPVLPTPGPVTPPAGNSGETWDVEFFQP